MAPSSSRLPSLLPLCALLFALEPPAFAQEPNLAQLQADAEAQAAQIRAAATTLPRVNVTHPDFGRGCANPADPSGQRDSTCAIRHALAFAEASAIPGGGYPVLYLPHGRYLVAGEGFTPALTITRRISIVGDGPGATTLMNTSHTAGTLAYNSADDCAGAGCFLVIRDLAFLARGHLSLGGLVELNSTNTGLMENVVLSATGGIALNAQGSSERWMFRDMEISEARWPILTEGDTNENYFDRVNVMNSAEDEAHFCFSVNCPGGHQPPANWTWIPDPHSAVYLDGDNVHFTNSSIKSTNAIGGVRMSATTSSESHTYFEGFPFNGQPRVNHSIAVGGKQELSHTTASISADALEIPVDDAGWQPLYVNNPADVQLNGEHSYTPLFGIYPADYQFHSAEPSRSVPGITRGTMEWVKVASFAGDGRAHLRSRGANGTRAIAWPAGSIMEQVTTGGYGQQWIEENHINSLFADVGGANKNGCDDLAQQTRWTGNPSRLCADILAGYVPDGYGVPFPAPGVRTPGFALMIEGNSIYYSENEPSGAGWIKIASGASVTVEQGDESLRQLPSASTAFNTYTNNTHLRVLQYPQGSAYADFHDLTAGVAFNTNTHAYSATVATGDGVGHVFAGEECWYALPPSGGGQPSSRFCIRPAGTSQETLVNGRWTPAR